MHLQLHQEVVLSSLDVGFRFAETPLRSRSSSSLAPQCPAFSRSSTPWLPSSWSPPSLQRPPPLIPPTSQGSPFLILLFGIFVFFVTVVVFSVLLLIFTVWPINWSGCQGQNCSQYSLNARYVFLDNIITKTQVSECIGNFGFNLVYCGHYIGTKMWFNCRLGWNPGR